MVAGLPWPAYAVPVSVAYARLRACRLKLSLLLPCGGLAYAAFGTSRQQPSAQLPHLDFDWVSPGHLAAGDALRQTTWRRQ